jgi:L-lysine 6-transaminase
MVSNVRGRGLFCAIDLATPELRNAVRDRCYAGGLIILGCGGSALRFRPALNITSADIDEGLGILRNALHASRS